MYLQKSFLSRLLGAAWTILIIAVLLWVAVKLLRRYLDLDRRHRRGGPGDPDRLLAAAIPPRSVVMEGGER
ncbi:MAG: hypothetical protein QM753_05880 [Thermomicrobiales bacterium]